MCIRKISEMMKMFSKLNYNNYLFYSSSSLLKCLFWLLVGRSGALWGQFKGILLLGFDMSVSFIGVELSAAQVKIVKIAVFSSCRKRITVISLGAWTATFVSIWGLSGLLILRLWWSTISYLEIYIIKITIALVNLTCIFSVGRYLLL